MRRISLLITSIALVLTGLTQSPVLANVGTTNCLTWVSDSTAVTITGGTSDCTETILIPSVLDVGSGNLLPVTKVDGSPFSSNISITTLNFEAPSYVEVIGDQMFGGNAIRTLSIPASVTTIGDNAFGWQYASDLDDVPTALTNVTFMSGSNLSTLSGSAFMANTNLRSITLPKSLVTLGSGVFDGATNLNQITFLGDQPTLELTGNPETTNVFRGLPENAKVNIPWNATGFTVDGNGKWNGLTVVRGQNPAIAADLAARTIVSKKKYVAKTLGKKVGLRIVSSKATVSMKVSSSSRKVCTKSGSKLKTLKPGKCVVTFTVQEPKPKSGKKPKATKTVKTLVVK